MPNLVPFSFDNTEIRVVSDERGEPWFVATDVATILDYNHVPHMARLLGEDEKGLRIVDTPGGPQEVTIISESGLYACILKSRKPDAQRFRKWVTAEVLPSLRRTGAYRIASPAASAIQPSLEFKALYEVATLIGLDQNVAAISANQAVVKLTGTNVLHLLGHEHLIAADQSSLFYTPTELGQRIGVSGRKFNLLLAEAGLQAKHGDKWAPMAAAEGLYRVLDTGKKHNDGTMVQQVKWSDRVLTLVDA